MKSYLVSLVVFISIFFSCKSSRQVTQTPVPKPVVVQPAPKPVEEKPKEISKQPKEIKIALLLPLYLEQNFEIDTSETEIDIEPRSFPGLSFYEGAMLAADSLAKSGMKVKLNVFDISPDSSAKHSILVKYQTLKNFDLVFANYPASQATAAAEEAKLLGLKMVLTQFGNISLLKNNPNLVLASPSTMTQCRLMADYVLDEYHYSNFIVLTRKIKRENELADVFKKETDSLLANKFKSENKCILFNYADSASNTLQNYFSTEKRNIIYFPSSDESFVSSVLGTIDTLNQKVTVVGLPTWENFETVQFSKFLNLEIYLFSGSHLDFEDEKIKSFRKKFIDHYKTDPLFTAYQGYDLLNYFSTLFNLYDKNFMEHTANESLNPVYKFLQSDSRNGFENTSISVLKYSDFQLLKVNK